MDSNLIYIRPVKVAFVRMHGDYVTSAAQAWARMFDWLSTAGLLAAQGCGYGLAHDNPDLVPDELCRYDACVLLPFGAEQYFAPDIRTQMMPGGPFARIRQSGSHANVRARFSHLRGVWMPSQGLKIDPSRPVVEMYLNDPNTCDENELRTDLCFPVLAQMDLAPGAAPRRVA